MKKLLFSACLLLWGAAAPAATTNIGPWTTLFRGVEISYVRVFGNGSGPSEKTEAINCLRIDLTEPTVRLLTTPKCTNCTSPNETLSENPSHFLEQNGLQVAVNGGFYLPHDPGSLDIPTEVYGLAISKGVIVSPQDGISHSGSVTTSATMLFSSNNVPRFVPVNWPPVNSNGYFTAITGDYILLTNGLNVGINNVNDLDPRTAIGISSNKQYLYLMTVDGRQGISYGINPPWSDGLNFYETADWLARFGAYEGMAVDGGGSTTMCLADCNGNSIRLNIPSKVKETRKERYIGHNFGVYAQPAPTDVRNVSVLPGITTAIVTWDTSVPADTQVEFGNTNTYGNLIFDKVTPLDSRLVRKHVATINGLSSNSKYFFRARSSDGVTLHTTPACSFRTTNSFIATLIFGITNAWKYTTNNLDGVNWKTLNYNDSGWFGPSNACLAIENRNLVSQGATYPPINTYLPPLPAMTVGIIGTLFSTYYFRTPFLFSGSTAGISLTFSNYIDDGAIFYLNGTELTRIRVAAAPTTVYFTNYATGVPCGGTGYSGDAVTICPDVFTISGNLLTNLFQGTNVVAVEVHDLATGTLHDLLFGSALFAGRPGSAVPRLFISSESGLNTIYWNGQGFTLQRSSNPSSPANWSDVPGPVTQSPFSVANSSSMFYRLRN